MDVTLGILDIKEREVGDIAPPTFPSPAPSTTGFPAHKKRVSAFKQQRQGKSATASPAPPSANRPPIPSRQNDAPRRDAKVDERRGIDQENKAVLDSMSPEEIAEAQKELYNGMDPRFIQMLLRRANLDEPTGPSPFDVAPPESSQDTAPPPPAKPRHVTVEDAPEELPEADPNPPPKRNNSKPKKTVTFDEDAPPPVPPPNLFPVTSTARPKTAPTKPTPDGNPSADAPHNTHFPPPPAVPDLDPSDPDFLETMHKKFFPNLPADPSKLAWMAPLPTPHSAADRESPYYPGQDSLPVSALRFDFTGALLPPRVSRQIPVSKGLHHHGEAPEAAGYTIPELARLARSSVAPQRCLAYQTLGRMLYRLGKGEWGVGAGGRGGEEDDLAFALWRCFKEGRVLESMEEEAGLPEGKGHRSSKAYATEALWLFEKGGWKERWRGM
ncbi:RPAP1-like protein [Parachaetomium inaequale]|uniref:RPAP1-like protein n=1 Tax=Parachaetomium inaequale TaxID=2588326 RepID=A0AAN6PNA5_9PEZI|nr:RPAP1-like protein [Parachaetomium inaequale]